MAAGPADGAKLYVTIVKIYKMMNHILEHLNLVSEIDPF